MFQFVLKTSGGTCGHLLKSTEAYVRARTSSSGLPLDLYLALSHDCKHLEQRILTRHALLKTAFEHHCVNPSQCKSVLVDPECTLETTMRKVREVLSNVADDSVQSLIEEADVRLIAHKLNWTESPYPKYKTSSGVVYGILEELEKKIGMPIDKGDFLPEEAKKPKEKQTERAKPSMALLLFTLVHTHVAFSSLV